MGKKKKITKKNNLLNSSLVQGKQLYQAENPSSTSASKIFGKRFSEDVIAYAILLTSLIFTILLRIRLLDIPLERDEGEYAYVGQQLLSGIPPFQSIYHVKFPGIYAFFALIETLFGQTLSGIHIGLLFVNIITGIIVFFIAKRLFTPISAALTTFCFFNFTISQTVFGFSANAEHFVLLFSMLGIFFELKATSNDLNYNGKPISEHRFRLPTFFSSQYSLLFYSGLSYGLAYTMKQQAVFFIIFGFVFFIFQALTKAKKHWQKLITRTIIFLVGIGLPFIITCLIFIQLGLFNRFWWWTWYYPRVYSNLIPITDGFDYFKLAFFSSPERTGIWTVFGPMILLALGGFIGLIRGRNIWNIIFFSTLSICSVCAVGVGFSFYPHYFILVAPALALLAIFGAETFSSLIQNKFIPRFQMNLSILLVFCSLAFSVYQERDYLFSLDGASISRSSYGGNPFLESLQIGNLIRFNTVPSDKVAVLGSEPQIYFYSGRSAATGYVYTYEMIADHPYAHMFQTEMIKEIEDAKPKYLIMINIPSSWFAREVKQVDTTLFSWYPNYVLKNYSQVGLIEDNSWCWDDPQKNIHCTPKAENWIAIYKRL